MGSCPTFLTISPMTRSGLRSFRGIKTLSSLRSFKGIQFSSLRYQTGYINPNPVKKGEGLRTINKDNATTLVQGLTRTREQIQAAKITQAQEELQAQEEANLLYHIGNIDGGDSVKKSGKVKKIIKKDVNTKEQELAERRVRILELEQQVKTQADHLKRQQDDVAPQVQTPQAYHSKNQQGDVAPQVQTQAHHSKNQEELLYKNHKELYKKLKNTLEDELSFHKSQIKNHEMKLAEATTKLNEAKLDELFSKKT